MGQDAFIHETTRATINTPQGENATLFANEAAARNADSVGARFQVKHSDGTFEPIIPAAIAGENFSIDMVGVLGAGNDDITITATPSVGVVGDYTYVWSRPSLNGEAGIANPTLVPVGANVVGFQNPGATVSRGMAKVVATHTLSGAIEEGFYWFSLAPQP